LRGGEEGREREQKQKNNTEGKKEKSYEKMGKTLRLTEKIEPGRESCESKRKVHTK